MTATRTLVLPNWLPQCRAVGSWAGRCLSKVEFLSDATGTFDYADVGQGAMSAADVHKATLTILAFSTAHVMTVEELRAPVTAGAPQRKAA